MSANSTGGKTSDIWLPVRYFTDFHQVINCKLYISKWLMLLYFKGHFLYIALFYKECHLSEAITPGSHTTKILIIIRIKVCRALYMPSCLNFDILFSHLCVANSKPGKMASGMTFTIGKYFAYLISHNSMIDWMSRHLNCYNLMPGITWKMSGNPYRYITYLAMYVYMK